MKKKLIDLLETLKVPVFQQGSLNENEQYPDSFFTFWNFENPDGQFYDNENHASIWGFWVFVYSNDPERVESLERDAKKLLKKNGFIFSGSEDADSGRETHTGRMMTFYIMEV